MDTFRLLSPTLLTSEGARSTCNCISLNISNELFVDLPNDVEVDFGLHRNIEGVRIVLGPKISAVTGHVQMKVQVTGSIVQDVAHQSVR